MTHYFQKYIDTFSEILKRIEVTDKLNNRISADLAILKLGQIAKSTHQSNNKLIFIGNGGSAGICSHMATDYSKNGNMRSLAFNDGAFLTCLSNDYGYENVFLKQIEYHGQPGDLLIAISSSGLSKNILNCAEEARLRGIKIVTLTGFTAENTLRNKGDLNFFIPDSNYGFVEVGHLTILHAALDIAMGWSPDSI